MSEAIKALSEADRSFVLKALPGWNYDGERNAIFRSLLCADFLEAMRMMQLIALDAEDADHHPEWFNVYNRIDIWLTTHDAGGVSVRDFNLARKIDLIAEQCNLSS